MLTATITVRLDHETDLSDWPRADLRALEVLGDVPDGARLVVVVAGRRSVSTEAAMALHHRLDTLLVDVHASMPWIARGWLKAIETGRPVHFIGAPVSRPEPWLTPPLAQTPHDPWAPAETPCQCRACLGGGER